MQPVLLTGVSRARRPAAFLATGLLVLLAGCASRSGDVAPNPTDATAYLAWDCEHLFEEIDAVQQRAADVAYAVDSRAGNNMIALGLGVTVFWPALLAMRPDGPEALELADLKGRYEAMRGAATARPCGAPPANMTARRQASLPVTLGDRLVYDERSGPGAAPHTLVMQVSALRREQIEFLVDLDGHQFSEPWRQDLAGNPVLERRAPLIGWRHLLKPGLALGQVVYGELAAAEELLPSARVRGQVVATGPQTVAGRDFDVAVIELFGEAPGSAGPGGDGLAGSTRLDGVMAVDRHSGVLLRLEMRCANSAFALRRRLMRVDLSPR